MSYHKATKRQRGWVTADEAKDDGRKALRAEDDAMVLEGAADAEVELDVVLPGQARRELARLDATVVRRDR